MLPTTGHDGINDGVHSMCLQGDQVFLIELEVQTCQASYQQVLNSDFEK